jgi:hypothetical protein
MPFKKELNFFYLFLQRHLKEKHGLHVERGDHKILTIPLLVPFPVSKFRTLHMLRPLSSENDDKISNLPN